MLDKAHGLRTRLVFDKGEQSVSKMNKALFVSVCLLSFVLTKSFCFLTKRNKLKAYRSNCRIFLSRSVSMGQIAG